MKKLIQEIISILFQDNYDTKIAKNTKERLLKELDGNMGDLLTHN